MIHFEPEIDFAGVRQALGAIRADKQTDIRGPLAVSLRSLRHRWARVQGWGGAYAEVGLSAEMKCLLEMSGRTKSVA